MSEAMLKIDNLGAKYGNITALKGISLEVHEGEIVTIVGANGAGKSTLLSCISGLMPYSGTIEFKGQRLDAKVDSAQRVRQGVVQVPEGRQIFSELSVTDNLKMGAYARKGKIDLQGEMAHIFELFPQLEERKHQKGGSLSGGEQQMLAMDRALMTKPRLLLLDETSMGLAQLLLNPHA